MLFNALLFVAAAVAAALGALHAFENGHGKSLAADYLSSPRRSRLNAVIAGIVVTASHTTGLFLLGCFSLYACRFVVPPQLYPWQRIVCGLMITALGMVVLTRNLAGKHFHAHGGNHSHGLLSRIFRSTPNVKHQRDGIEHVSLRQLLALELKRGLLPSSAAAVVFLSALALRRVGLGLILIACFGVGLATVIALTRMGPVPRFKSEKTVARFGPAAVSFFVMLLGVGFVLSSSTMSSVSLDFLPSDKAVPFVTVILLGLFLGMRHSTDPDHVVAVSTIVSRHKSIKHSAMIGLLWGLGHSLTIFLVGSLIICFGVIIPPRLGLSMEFSVALMLILLGVLNLTGVLRWITERLTPAQEFTSPIFKTSESLMETVAKLGLFQTLRPFAIGLVHGLAGSAAVALLVLSTIHSPVWAAAYLLVFGAGTMIGMMLMTTAIAMPLAYTGKKFLSANRYMTATSGVLSMAFGLFLVYQIGLVDGLFTAQPHWIPQ